MRELKLFLLLCFTLSVSVVFGQKVTIEGYVFEDGNRGYLNVAEVLVLDAATKTPVTKALTNKNGVFLAEVDPGKEYLVQVTKKVFEEMEMPVSTVGKSAGESVYMKVRMKRKPGYRFEVTMAEPREDDEPVNAIQGSTIEVYNNTTEEPVLDLKNHPVHTFALNFEQGNHYTVMIRKEGYFVKRMEAYVNVEGCILCFDGVGEVTPGVSDVLTERNKQGTLLANVEIQPIKMNKAIEIDNIYYENGSARLRTAARAELDKLVGVLKDNPTLLIEIGAHTDSNGKDDFNQKLSERRAKGVVDYLVLNGVSKQSLISKGYGETELVNKCKNGVDCSDRRHAQNRRTELKVVGYNNTGEAKKSLFEIKEEEKFEKMLNEIQNSEQVQVQAGEELPDEIKNQLSAEEIDKKIKEQEKQSGTTGINEPPMSMKVDKPVVPEGQQVPSAPMSSDKVPTTQPTVKKVEQVKEQTGKLSGSTNYRRQETTTPNTTSVQKKVEKPVTEIIKETITPTTSSIPASSATPAREAVEENFGNNLSNVDDDAIFNNPKNDRSQGEVRVNTANTLRKANELPVNYTGYKVEFMTSMSELPMSHDIFSRHGNIYKEQRKDGSYAYLLGDFKAETNAYNFLDSIMKERYPNARVIGYELGRRKN